VNMTADVINGVCLGFEFFDDEDFGKGVFVDLLIFRFVLWM